ncbi:MAG: ArsC/Spx/MgsR family protein [Pseudomonadota bacterium]
MSESINLYGLKNCDGCRKAQRALEGRGLRVVLRDIRDADNVRQVIAWIKQQPDWTPFLNKRSTTWRSLPDEQKERLDAYRAQKLMQAHPTLIKRPVLRIGDHTLAGYRDDEVTRVLSQA